ncbi:LacI family DNA-binding transcriptional regulator [Mucilaginibacter boryungensis]|uniref:LacI family DNA-binding transcriptional regulator n=1 Tax=Mucilaginibacter boryungensis TaxID=768480 RepID=A0ABR9XFC6_9SPHI|nr:LacI family DNA-binding transcriptional regulator [Mucilaginibacter boryungensis]MBE9665872.1 LacI family DNA-binding transcriptional regulator [Mucilaginibacter boryungensis]
MNPKKRVTIYDIARKLNLTASSVSRALSNNKNVNENTRQLILKTAAEMKYKPNTLASNLRKGKSQTIGVVVPRINQNFFSNVIAGIEAVTYQRGYNLVICQSNELHDKEVQCINTLINQHVDCIVISVSAEGSDYTHLQNVIDHHIQLIQFDRVADNLETLKVINANEQASMEAVLHMVGQGYKRIALLEGPQNLHVFRERKAGYLNALKTSGLPVIDELIVANAKTKELGTEAVRKLLSLPNPPDAIFASRDDFSALGVLEVATAIGIKVPDELGICGYSNEDFTSITSPSITTIDQYSMEMGKTIANSYFDQMDNKMGNSSNVNKTISIKPKLIIRTSTQK